MVCLAYCLPFFPESGISFRLNVTKDISFELIVVNIWGGSDAIAWKFPGSVFPLSSDSWNVRPNLQRLLFYLISSWFSEIFFGGLFITFIKAPNGDSVREGTVSLWCLLIMKENVWCKHKPSRYCSNYAFTSFLAVFFINTRTENCWMWGVTTKLSVILFISSSFWYFRVTELTLSSRVKIYSQ